MARSVHKYHMILSAHRRSCNFSGAVPHDMLAKIAAATTNTQIDRDIS
jgi:hypothetical protein